MNSVQDSQLHSSLDTALDILADRYRRKLLFALLEENPQDASDPQTSDDVRLTSEELASTRIGMNHTHLPKLEDAGFIEWNRDSNTVEKGPRFDEVRPLLELMDDHADELPDDWL